MPDTAKNPSRLEATPRSSDPLVPSEYIQQLESIFSRAANELGQYRLSPKAALDAYRAGNVGGRITTYVADECLSQAPAETPDAETWARILAAAHYGLNLAEGVEDAGFFRQIIDHCESLYQAMSAHRKGQMLGEATGARLGFEQGKESGRARERAVQRRKLREAAKRKRGHRSLTTLVIAAAIRVLENRGDAPSARNVEQLLREEVDEEIPFLLGTVGVKVDFPADATGLPKPFVVIDTADEVAGSDADIDGAILRFRFGDGSFRTLKRRSLAPKVTTLKREKIFTSGL